MNMDAIISEISRPELKSLAAALAALAKKEGEENFFFNLGLQASQLSGQAENGDQLSTVCLAEISEVMSRHITISEDGYEDAYYERIAVEAMRLGDLECYDSRVRTIQQGRRLIEIIEQLVAKEQAWMELEQA